MRGETLAMGGRRTKIPVAGQGALAGFEVTTPPIAAPIEGDHKRVKLEICERYQERYGSPHTWGAKQSAQVAHLLKQHDAPEIIRRWAILFKSPPRWLREPFHLGTLVANFDALVTSGPRKPSDVLGGIGGDW